MEAVGFGYKTAWLAIKDVDIQRVAEAMHVSALREADWQSVMDAAYPKSDDYSTVFVTPPVDGWILCASAGLFSYGDGDAPLFPDLIQYLADRLGTEVQWFCTHRVSDAHGWGRASPDKLHRAFMYANGAPVMNDGLELPSRAELEIGYPFNQTTGKVPAGEPREAEDFSWLDEQHVLQVAERWSVNPLSLDGRDLPAGWVGRLPALPLWDH